LIENAASSIIFLLDDAAKILIIIEIES